ncbi:receptor-type tyrosine-protein phosphatase beta-like [Lineus longissimus]|uniref:receptor-type tyrosine-protein phosphatase beta-like n=1 Tax=Lineus longissimus TaxID=88925 RepID=UPI00315D6729
MEHWFIIVSFVLNLSLFPVGAAPTYDYTSEDLPELWKVGHMYIGIDYVTTTTAKVSWSRLAGNFEFYRIQITPMGSGAKVHPSIIASISPDLDVSITKLIPGYWYVVEVMVVRGAHESLVTSTGFYARPQSVDPATINFRRITATSADISWKPVTGNLDYYVVETSQEAAITGSIGRKKVVRTSRATLKGLVPGIAYTVTITTKVGSTKSKTCRKTFSTKLPSTLPPEPTHISEILKTSTTCTVINRPASVRHNITIKPRDKTTKPRTISSYTIPPTVKWPNIVNRTGIVPASSEPHSGYNIIISVTVVVVLMAVGVSLVIGLVLRQNGAACWTSKGNAGEDCGATMSNPTYENCQHLSSVIYDDLPGTI